MTPTRLIAICFSVLVFFTPAMAENIFAPAAKVNDQVVTKYEVEQRVQFMTLLGSAGNTPKEVVDTLINEKLQLQAASALGIALTDEQMTEGMTEFSGRANLTTDKFIQALEEGGVAKETFRDFISAGLAWRELVGAKFGPRSQVSEAEIDRAVALSSSKGGIRVLLSEIILPADTPELTEQNKQVAEQISKIRSMSAFSAKARQVSAASSRGQGGRLGWMPLSNLPEELRGTILALSPGKVTAPISIPNGIVLFQMRAIEETNAPRISDSAIEYARYLIAGGRSEAALKEAARIKDKVDTCDDFYGIALGQPKERLTIETREASQIPKNIAIELAKLDKGEISTNLTSANGENLVFLMLCGRTPKMSEDVSRDTIRTQLINQRVAAYADGFLAELRADAHITIYP